ncbi:MAG: SAM-dependent methyltransferase [Pseudomonadota bacterium]
MTRYRTRRAESLPQSRFLIDHAVDSLVDRLRIIQRPLPHLVIVGGRLTCAQLQAIRDAARATHITVIDDVPAYLAPHTAAGTSCILARSSEWPIATRSVDCVVSLMDLHTANDVVGALAQIQISLKADGLVLGALFGGDTLFELRASLMQADMDIRGGIRPRISPMLDKLALGDLLRRANFALPVVDSDVMTISYRSFSRLLNDLRNMGEANMLHTRLRGLTPPRVLQTASTLYQNAYAQDDGLLAATFEILYFIGWTPHSTQQKPLPRGSGQVSLADIL